ncbi:CaiB/BaiF CoA transferase family protein [Dethiobacter alkaliphilus]|uniref:CaiB/BaiF CoA transferase family protein n=1 Tax=Dethiobacter alkaliphilus TaxID=427926 RepID=UPI002226AA7C|nr:CaiB/BaiF CoA-transferase family protein [Dethiobacter alkaliphilus]MCW3489845.1 CoA transferase [Dethiobacter alkaliphilus]
MNLLEGIRILDLTRLYPGPFCTMMLADMGGDVIKVESPGEGDYFRKMGPMDGEDSHYFRLLNRNKKSITLNLKDPKGVELFLRLAADADVVVEGFRPGVVDSLGIGYDQVRRINEKIIYCSITGYGQDGPLRDRAGHDLNYIALSGILDITGQAGGPPVIPGVQIGDVGGGTQMALSAILAALFARERGKGGTYIDVAMLDGLVSWLPISMAEVFAGNDVKRGEAELNGGLACYSVYKTADGGYMALGALEKKFWLSFCAAVGRNDLRDVQYQQDQAGLKKELAGIFGQKNRRQWEEIFAGVDACCEPVLSLPEVKDHPQVKAREMVTGKSLSFPVRFKDGGPVQSEPAPAIGEHTEEVLLTAGLTDEDILKLKQEGVLGSRGC